MFIELVDALRCPSPHEESWLVASATRTEARHIVEGVLGCPVCQAEFPVRRGVVDFRRNLRLSSPAGVAPDADQALRLAAFLDLSDGLGFAVLLGAWGAHASLLRTMVDTPLVLANPPANLVGEPGLSLLRCDEELPLAVGAARAIALDAGSPRHVESAVRATRAKGRLVAPVTVPLPAGVQELARDDTLWVGERGPLASPVVSLRMRRG